MFAQSKEALEFKQALQKFSAATYAVKQTHSYAAGYYESVMGSMFEALTKKQKAQFLRDMREAAVRFEALAEVATGQTV